MEHVPRNQEPVLHQLLRLPGAYHDVILVEGARQVGKTTLVQEALRRIDLPVTSLNLEQQTLIRSRIDDTEEFREFEELLLDDLGFDPRLESVLFIDEAQESHKLGGYVRFMKEAWPAARVVLSGSTLARVFRDNVRYPVGRVRRLVVRPFTFSEYLIAGGRHQLASLLQSDPSALSPRRHERLLTHLDRYLLVGGLPEVALARASGDDFIRRRAEIVADYEQDFIRLFGEDSIAIVKGCLRSVANFVGSPSKNASVIPQPTSKINDEIRRVFERLESWRLLLHSEQRGPSPEASHRFLPKRYMFDTGVLRHLREKGVPSISILNTLNAAERRPLGGMVENQVAIELADQFGELSGWKKSSAGLEIDFIGRIGERSIPIECKAVLQLKQTHLRGLGAYLQQHGQTFGVMISLAPFSLVDGPNGTNIMNVPLYLAERLLELAQECR